MATELIKPSQKRKWLELYIIFAVSLAAVVLFRNGWLDFQLAEQFFFADTPHNHWPTQFFWLWDIFYQMGYPSVIISGAVALLLFVAGFFQDTYRQFQSRALYCLIIILIGPGLVVNLILKDHWGRPRPREVIEFNGDYQYQPPWVRTNTGKKSFVCGHCSAGYMFFSLYFVLSKGRHIALILTLVYSILMGLARMSAGGHFISDIVWSGIVVFFLCWIFYYILFREFKAMPENQQSALKTHSFD